MMKKVQTSPGTPVFTHYTTAMQWYAPHDLGGMKINDSKIEIVTEMGIKKKVLSNLFGRSDSAVWYRPFSSL